MIDWPTLTDQELERLWLHGATKEIQDAAHAERVARNERLAALQEKLDRVAEKAKEKSQ